MAKSASGNLIADCIENSKPGGPVRWRRIRRRRWKKVRRRRKCERK
jgi:hypothetical protein